MSDPKRANGVFIYLENEPGVGYCGSAKYSISIASINPKKREHRLSLNMFQPTLGFA